MKLHLSRVPASGPDQYGLAVLELSLYDDHNNRIDHVAACSGQSYAQNFRRGDDPHNLPGNMEPLPEGVYDVSLPEWAGSPLDYGTVFNQGLGPVVLELTPRFSMRRGSLLIHQDFNRDYAPGTAGCCGIIGHDALKHVIEGWFGKPAEYGPAPRVLAVNWGLGSCAPIAEVR